jgi:rare lipoprotein A
MIRRLRDIAPLAAVLLLSLPASGALAQQYDGSDATGGSEATVDRPALELAPGGLLGRAFTVRGRTSEGDAGRTVDVQLRALDGSWIEIASTQIEDDGTFAATWKPDVTGRITLRALVRGDDSARAASDPLVADTTVFVPEVSSWYGPGFWGRKTACGIKLTKTTIGVAHRKLPCGTQVDVYYKGRTLTVPVIDRGPFKKGRKWDLTQAAAQKLGVGSTTTIGVLVPEGAKPLRKKKSS